MMTLGRKTRCNAKEDTQHTRKMRVQHQWRKQRMSTCSARASCNNREDGGGSNIDSDPQQRHSNSTNNSTERGQQ